MKLARPCATRQLRGAATHQTMHPRLNELLDYVDAQRSALLSAVSALPPERWTERPDPSRWSVADLFEHLCKVEHSCAQVIARGVAAARAAGHPEETESHSVLGTLDTFAILDRSQRREAPERVAPTGTWSANEARENLSASRAELHEAMRAGDGLQLGTIHQSHARLGELDLYGWILFIGKHEARHVQQAREIVEQVGASPRSVATAS